MSQNGYGGIGIVALRAVHCIVIVVADSHRCGGWIKELGPIEAYSTRLNVFGEWRWIAIVAAHGHRHWNFIFRNEISKIIMWRLMTELGPIDAYSTRLTGFSEWCWIAIVAADCSL